MSFTIVMLILAASVVFFATGAACFVFALMALKGGETYEPDRLVAVELEDRSDQEVCDAARSTRLHAVAPVLDLTAAESVRAEHDRLAELLLDQVLATGQVQADVDRVDVDRALAEAAAAIRLSRIELDQALTALDA